MQPLMRWPLTHARTILIIFLLVGAYSTHSSNWRLESYWGVGAYSEVGADSVPYGIKKLFFRVSKTSSYFSTISQNIFSCCMLSFRIEGHIYIRRQYIVFVTYRLSTVPYSKKNTPHNTVCLEFEMHY